MVDKNYNSDTLEHNNMFNFMNTTMDDIYKILFNDVLPRVLEDMRIMLQSSLEDKIGDWFLHK